MRSFLSTFRLGKINLWAPFCAFACLCLCLGLGGQGCAQPGGALTDGDGPTSIDQGDVGGGSGGGGSNVGGNGNTGGGTGQPLPDQVSAAHPQSTLAYMATWPTVPGCTSCSGYTVRDWKDASARYHALLFDTATGGPYLPLAAIDEVGKRIGMASYVGQAANANNSGEGLAVLGGLLGASLSNVDMRAYQGKNWMALAQGYSASPNGRPYVVNNPGNTGILSAWYVLFPTILEAHLASIYRSDASLGLTPLLLSSASVWQAALDDLVDNWNHSGYDFRPATRGPVDGGSVEPDMALGIAYVSELAFAASGGTRPEFDAAAARVLASMDARTDNPIYQVLGYYGPLVAARRNALRGGKHDVGHYLDWVFSQRSAVRNWAMLSGRWGSYDVYGLVGGVGSTAPNLGTAYSLYSMTAASALAPVARYAPAYAQALGRYLLQVAVNAQQFFPDAVGSDRQDAFDVYQLLQAPIAYEQINGKTTGESYATGGASRPVINQAPYSAWAQGYMAALFAPTNVTNVLMVDLLATDPWHPPAHPSYLLYNPNPAAASVEVAVAGSAAVDFYDAVSGKTLARDVAGRGNVTVAPGAAVVLVMPPTGQAVAKDGIATTIGGVAVDWASNK